MSRSILAILLVIIVSASVMSCGRLGPVAAATTPEDPSKFKLGLYEGADTAYGFDVVAHVAYFRADSGFEFYEYKKLEDYDSIVCWRQTHARFVDSGAIILFDSRRMRYRDIDSLKTAANPWGAWEEKEDRRVAKKSFYDDYGHDFFVLLDLGGDAAGNYWSMNVRSRWIGPEDQPPPFFKD